MANMTYDEYNKLLLATLDRIAEKKKEQEIAEPESLALENNRAYSTEDVIYAVAQVSPNDTKLARDIIDEIETKIRPREMLNSVQDKIKYHKHVETARTSLYKEKRIVRTRFVKDDLEYLAKQGVIETEDVKQYLRETELLEMVVSDEIPKYLLKEGIEKRANRVALTAFVTSTPLYSILAFTNINTHDDLAEKVFLSLGLLLTGTITALFTGAIHSETKGKSMKKANEQKAKDRMKEYEHNFAHNMINLESLIGRMRERLSLDNVGAYNKTEEKEIIRSMSKVGKYLDKLSNEMPEIKRRYAQLKSAEYGLPVERLLTEKK